MTATVHTGQMRHKATFQINTPVAQTGGGEKDAFTDLVTTRGYLKKDSGNRTLEAGELVINNQWTFTCRYFATINTSVTKTARVVVDGRYFTIMRYDIIDMRNFLYRFYLKEQQ